MGNNSLEQKLKNMKLGEIPDYISKEKIKRGIAAATFVIPVSAAAGFTGGFAIGGYLFEAYNPGGGLATLGFAGGSGVALGVTCWGTNIYYAVRKHLNIKVAEKELNLRTQYELKLE